MQLLVIAISGAVGTLARYGLQGLVQLRVGSTLPYGTLLVNLTGCFFLGLIGQFTMNRMVLPADWRPAITVGFFGGYTTFSSFGWETAKMLEDGEWLRATALRGCKRGGGPAVIRGWHPPRQHVLVVTTGRGTIVPFSNDAVHNGSSTLMDAGRRS